MSTLRPEAGILPAISSPVAQQSDFGERLRALRKDRQMTLQQASKVTGVAQSTLSKMENNQLSPTFNLMQKLAVGLGIDMPQLFAPVKEVRISGRRTVTKRQQGREHLTATYEHELLATELDSKRMVPFKSRVRARTLEEFGGWVKHEGEESLVSTMRAFMRARRPSPAPRSVCAASALPWWATQRASEFDMPMGSLL